MLESFKQAVPPSAELSSIALKPGACQTGALHSDCSAARASQGQLLETSLTKGQEGRRWGQPRPEQTWFSQRLSRGSRQELGT